MLPIRTVGRFSAYLGDPALVGHLGVAFRVWRATSGQDEEAPAYKAEPANDSLRFDT